MKAKDKPSYDRLKQYQGKGYSGMKIGRTHRWTYDRGEWRERKVSPDEWEIAYQTPKRRAAKAPEDSGAPVGTAYNWLIVSHQRVDKLDANTYMTWMEGRKFKVAHKRAEKSRWSASEKAQRKKVIQYLEQMIDQLKGMEEDDLVPYSQGEHEHIYGLSLRTKDELKEIAAQHGIPVNSRMKREELLDAVRTGLNGQRQKVAAKATGPKETEARPKTEALKNKTKTDLYRMASERHISGRSDMNKAQLLQALSHQMRQERPAAH